MRRRNLHTRVGRESHPCISVVIERCYYLNRGGSAFHLRELRISAHTESDEMPEIVSDDLDPFSDARKAYPWEEWADGQTRRFSRGQDFGVSARDFVRVARLWAAKHGYQVSARISGDLAWLRLVELHPVTLTQEPRPVAMAVIAFDPSWEGPDD
jgi:hypothetical protein